MPGLINVSTPATVPVDIFLKGLNTIFMQSFIETKTDWERLASKVPSNSATEKYPWLGAVPGVRKKKGEIVPRGLGKYNYAIDNEEWESSMEIPIRDIRRDKYGQINIRVNELGIVAKQHIDELIFDLMENGDSRLCYDGQYFFDTDHQERDSGVQSNKGTEEFGIKSLSNARIAGMRFKNDQGKPMRLVFDLLVGPPEREDEMLEAVKASTLLIAGTAERLIPNFNVHQGRFDVLTTPLLSNTKRWYLFCTKRAIKPFIYQEEEAMKPNHLGEKSDHAVKTGNVLYIFEGSYNAGYGYWQLAYGSFPTGG